MAVLCPVCAQENPEVARFCLACGAALTAEPPREERKVVTVLFADLVGFTSRAEQLDPEDVRAVLSPYWERLRGELEKRGGTVEKFIGDAVMALFGAPAAHDDDPLRAVGAALAIRDWAREEADVQVRIAVNTGEALVLLGARPAEGEGMAAGDVVNTTARLQSAAPVNGVLVGEATYRATRDVIDYVEHEPVTAKGKADPIPVWEAVQVRSRLGMDVERATTPLVGRTRELGVIVDAFERAKSEREPQLVTLVGVPGIGKSRLVGAFFSHLESSPDLVWWRQGRAMPYGEGVSFWAVAEMVKAHAGIEENDAPDVAEDKLRSSVERVVDDGDRAWVLDHLLPFVGVEAGARSGDSAPAWRTFFEGLADQRPLVLVFEDMHWADDGLLDFIDHLVDWATGVPLLVIATARPELLDRRPAWGGGKLNVSTIALTPLSDGEAAQVIHNVLEQAALPVEVQQALLERAGGNPLYAEQFARLYVERGSAEDLPMPETVQGLIAARLDGLSADEKRIAQDASVFGKVFWGGALDADDASLHSLERKGILRRERRSSVGGETQYAFRHVLVRDVAYGQIPRADRSQKHVRAADWIERLGRAEDHAELVAHHLSSAAEYGADTGDRLRVALRRAGERAVALGAHPAAERYFAQALAAWPEDDPQWALVLAGHARALADATGDLGELVPALDALEAAGLREEAAQFAAYASNAVWRGGKGGALPIVERGLSLLEGLPSSPALAHLRHEEARLRVFQGDLDRARVDLADAAELAGDVDDAELRAEILATQAVVTIHDGDVAKAIELSQGALSLAPPWSAAEMRCLTNLSVFAYTDADHENAGMWLDRGIDRATRSGDLMRLRWLEVGLTQRSFELGDWDDALRRADENLGQGTHYNDQGALLVSGMIHASRGALDEARRRRDRALARADEQGDQQSTVPTRMGGAWISYLVGDGERCRELVEEALPLIERGNHRAPALGSMGPSAVVHAGHADDLLHALERCAPIVRIEAVRLALRGDWLAAAELWAHISPNDEALGRVHAAHALAAEGRRAEAELQLERGLAFYRAVGARRIIELFEAPLRAAAAAE